MYYYFATSERNSTTDPVIIWINGGPACSGFSAFLHSIGKHHISELYEVLHDYAIRKKTHCYSIVVVVDEFAKYKLF
mgnify:CR=1 FL=1